MHSRVYFAYSLSAFLTFFAMLALSFGLLLVMGTVALLLADMERKRRIIVDLLNQLLPLVARSRRLAMANPAASQWQSGTSL